MPGKEGGFTLVVPVDYSWIGADSEDQGLKIVAQARDGTLTSAPVARKAQAGTATLAFAADPGHLRVLAGPQRVADEDIVRSQTLSLDVASQAWTQARTLTLAPIAISPYYWHWWLFWCREYVIRGRLICADGSPVPGADVCAYDVDWWFWWRSTELVGCATTDINGTFELSFRFCCGLWPWWWWAERVWQLDPDLAGRVGAVLERDPRLSLGRAKNQPSLEVFSDILAPLGIKASGVLQAADADRLEQIRGAVVAYLPAAPELEAFGVWPWVPWRPWWDCTPDILFRATQNCSVPGAVVVSEGIAETHWNIANPLEVVLTANDLACCVPSGCGDRPCPEGECLVVSDICGIVVDEISGNPGAPTAPRLGLADPGGVAPGACAWAGDRPFAGEASVYYANVMTGVDYYEIEYSTSGLPTSWNPLPVAATPTITRQYIDTTTLTFPYVSFPFQSISGHWVVKSREYYQATSGWDPLSDFWIGDPLLVTIDSTQIPAGDGTYWFRVVGWEIDSGGNLINRKVLPLCDTKTDNGWVLTFDNPAAGPYPDAQIVEVVVDGESVDPCGVIAQSGGTLEVVFVAHDPDGWLGGYTLEATYGLDQSTDLLSQPSSQLTAISADCVGPQYGRALLEPPTTPTPCGAPFVGTACASAPTWYGGEIRLTIDLSDAFPEPCCYQINLNVWTRHILDCQGSPAPYQNTQWYTIGYGVCEPGTAVAMAGEAVDVQP